MNTDHAARRCRQRGIEPLTVELLERFGATVHDGRGATVRFFDKASRRRMERDLGQRAVARFHEWTDAYLVVASDGSIVTAGHRTRRIRRP